MSYLKSIFAALFLTLVVLPGSAQSPELAARLDEVFDTPRYSHAFWGVRVESEEGRVLYDRLGSKCFVPASNMKVFTTACALDLLGPEFHYETRLEAVGSVSTHGTLKGSLVIVGSGDPSLGSWHLDEGPDGRELLSRWVEAVKKAGIREIRGNVIADGRVFSEEYHSDDWELEDYPYWYAAGSSGVAFEENCFRFTTAPGPKPGAPAVITLNPDTDYITVVNHTTTVKAGGKKTADIVWREPRGNTVIFAGTVPIDEKPFEQRGSVWDGNLYAATLLTEALEEAGIRVRGEAQNIRSLAPDEVAKMDLAGPGEKKLVAVYHSPPLSDLLKIINKTSHNFFADQLLRTLGSRHGESSDFAESGRVVQQWLEEIGAPEPEKFYMLDGSGLARRDLIQPRQATFVLRSMASKDLTGKAFWESISVSGVDGDLDYRMKAPPLQGTLQAKTGYIGQVRSLSGRVRNQSGQWLYFSMIANHHLHSLYDADKLIDEACLILAGTE
jgi:serine-type D-Ala-D-Ala carboxypeptidase/endopeptidase (penicillin-binding protein 4)